MADYKKSDLWKNAFENPSAKSHATSVARLISSYISARENVKQLVSNISIDLPSFTVHDIEHIDALWEVAGQILGEQYTLNPVEGYVLGCSFLLHDAGMTLSSYPNGIDEIKSTREWQKIKSKIFISTDGNFDDNDVIEVFIREQHAVRAEKLPFIEWNSDSGSRFIIEDGDLRQRFGDFIGSVSASHWWSYDELEKKFADSIIPAPAPFPSAWSIDLLKLACILRTADAAQIDDRRAPSFLAALRKNRLNWQASQHWTFQSRLSQAQNRDDTLYFASFRPFTREDAPAWWLMYDTLKAVDGELRSADDLLSRKRLAHCRFSARRVANVESPETMQVSIPIIGWRPVDTAFSVSDIPRLVANLGGDQLYGENPLTPLREIVQNAIDAVRMRKLVDPQFDSGSVSIEIIRQTEKNLIRIRDNGVGLSEFDVIHKLLTFGTSGWRQDLAIGEYNDQYPLEDSVSGRYGIGFFSLFMIADEIKVISRRFDTSPEKTLLLVFNAGLRHRPLLSNAEYANRMTAGGTTIEVIINKKHSLDSIFDTEQVENKTAEGGVHRKITKAFSAIFPACEVPISVIYEGNTKVIDGRHWQSEPAISFLERLGSENIEKSRIGKYLANLTLVKEKDGTVVGRAGLVTTRQVRFRRMTEWSGGAVVAHGAALCRGYFIGILLGRSIRASRDDAAPLASSEALAAWATEQSKLLCNAQISDAEQVELASQICALRGDPGSLKVCEVNGTMLNCAELADFVSGRDEIWVVQDAAVSLSKTKLIEPIRCGDSIGVDYGLPTFIEGGRNGFAWFDRNRFLDNDSVSLDYKIVSIIADNFGIDKSVIKEYTRIHNGRAVYKANCPTWKSAAGEVVYNDGLYFKRNMSMDDLSSFKFEYSNDDDEDDE